MIVWQRDTFIACAFVVACGSSPPPSISVEITPLPSKPQATASTTSTSTFHRVARQHGPDRDGDGIADDVDKCPDDPEDYDGFQDADGCPDPDNDGDGIPDALDYCPNVPGPPPNGCP